MKEAAKLKALSKDIGDFNFSDSDGYCSLRVYDRNLLKQDEAKIYVREESDTYHCTTCKYYE